MTKEHRETEVVRDPETGRVTGYVEHVEERPKKKSGGGGLILGLLLGALFVVGGVAIYANSQGGYQQAGIEADQAVEQAQTETSQASDQIGQTAENLGDEAERTGDNIQSSMQ
ncbi:MAG: hypothetical protein ABW199_11350 [Caulobacterales bacterium]